MAKNNNPDTTTIKIDLPTIPKLPNEISCDAVIIGGGPNGLTTGAYLAKAGLNVILCERRYEVGGGLATEEILFPGYFANTHATYHMMTDYIPAIRDFNMSQHSLQFVKPNLQTGIVFKDGSSIIMHNKIQETASQIMKFSREDAVAFEKYSRLFIQMIDEILAPGTYYKPIPQLELAVHMERTEIGKEVAKISENSPVEIIEGIFKHEKVKALMLYVTSMWGLSPRDGGLGFLVPLLSIRCGMNKCICLGGSHKFASSLSKEIIRNKGLILENAEVSKIIIENGKAAGVQLFDGQVIKAKTVISSLDPDTTFNGLVGKSGLPEDLATYAKNWKWDKWSFFTTHAAIKEPLKYRAEDRRMGGVFMNILGIETMDDVLKLTDNIQAGKTDFIAGHSTVESLYDPHLSKATGKHTAFFQVLAPGKVDGGWESKHHAMEQAVLKKWGEYAENLDGNIIKTRSESPLDIEKRIPCMKYGSIKHGDYNAFQMGYFRPNDLCSETRTPIQGLYVCGASTYPGGLILCGPGYIAANVVAEDMGVKKWWDMPESVKKYVEAYIK